MTGTTTGGDPRRPVIRQAKEQEMGVILMRPLTSGVFQRLMAEAFLEIDTLKAGRLLLNYVLLDPYVDVALVGVREPRFVELNDEISDDVASRIDGCEAHLGAARSVCALERIQTSFWVDKWIHFRYTIVD